MIYLKRGNVLILSAGRRVELYQAMAAAACRLLPSAQIICADLHPELSAACLMCGDYVALPSVRDPRYPGALADVCRDRSIGMVIPTIDTELIVLSGMREDMRAHGTEIVISDSELIEACVDKRLTSILFAHYGIPTPAIYDRNSIEFPCFSKPASGSSSIGAFRIDRRDDISDEMWTDADRMFMELITDDMIEYTLDLYYDQRGALKCLVPRERIATRGGEIAKGATRRNWLGEYIGEKLGILDGARGCITLQAFADTANRSIAAIEINPRFGGGVPLTFAAGADYPGWLLSEYLLGEEIPHFDAWESDLLMLRYDSKVLSRKYQQ